MREFFRGWRRKAGLVTLGLACALMAGWMRSYLAKDEVLIPAAGRQHVVFSTDGILFWMAWNEKSPRFHWMSQPLLAVDEDDPGERYLPNSRLLFDYDTQHGILLSEAALLSGKRQVQSSFFRWGICHWLLAIPLTLLSAWLILGKARPAKESSRG